MGKGLNSPRNDAKRCKYSNEQGRCDDALGERGVELPVNCHPAAGEISGKA